MSDRELVIKIPEEEYINIKDAINSLIENGVERASVSKVCLAILDSTPLPKGHGDLKDIGECNRKLFYQQCGGANSLITVKTAFDMLLSLPTILKADKESTTKIDLVVRQLEEEADYAYADFEEYKKEVLGADFDELPDDDFRYGLKRAIEIIKAAVRSEHEKDEA